ncbi:MAG: hypothetical protein WBM83_05655 [Flavobacteriaceae bacterium]
MEKRKIYKTELVQEIGAFYGALLTDYDRFSTIKDHLSALASRMWEGVQAENKAVLSEIANYHWDHLGKSATTLKKAALTEADCQKAIANEYGFRRWTEVQHVTIPYNIPFENLVDAMLTGDLEQVKSTLSENKDLVNIKSNYGHRATLLHYAASNGVELWRQKVPMNLPVILKYLSDQGINKKAKMKVYNGEYTATELLLSSAHPFEAGLIDELRPLF